MMESCLQKSRCSSLLLSTSLHQGKRQNPLFLDLPSSLGSLLYTAEERRGKAIQLQHIWVTLISSTWKSWETWQSFSPCCYQYLCHGCLISWPRSSLSKPFSQGSCQWKMISCFSVFSAWKINYIFFPFVWISPWDFVTCIRTGAVCQIGFGSCPGLSENRTSSLFSNFTFSSDFSQWWHFLKLTGHIFAHSVCFEKW